MEQLPVPPMVPGWNQTDREAMCIVKNVFEFLFTVMLMAYLLCCVMKKDFYGCNKITDSKLFGSFLFVVSILALAMAGIDTAYNENSGYVMADEGVSKTIMAFTSILVFVYFCMFINKIDNNFMTRSYSSYMGLELSAASVSLVMAFILFCLVIKQWSDNADMEYKSMMVQVPEAAPM